MIWQMRRSVAAGTISKTLLGARLIGHAHELAKYSLAIGHSIDPDAFRVAFRISYLTVGNRVFAPWE